MDIQTQMEDCCTLKNCTSTGCDPIQFDEMKYDQSEEITTRTFKDNCIQTLCNIMLITTLVARLSNAGCLENFVKLVKQVSDGTVSAMNIAFLLCLDVARFHSCVIYCDAFQERDKAVLGGHIKDIQRKRAKVILRI